MVQERVFINCAGLKAAGRRHLAASLPFSRTPRVFCCYLLMSYIIVVVGEALYYLRRRISKHALALIRKACLLSSLSRATFIVAATSLPQLGCWCSPPPRLSLRSPPQSSCRCGHYLNWDIAAITISSTCNKHQGHPIS